jgi:YidC/Oxa1 family membrane protein insertase
MEKRALVALVLSLAVLLFWEYFFGLYRTETPPPQKQEQAAPATTPEAQPGAIPPTAGLPVTPAQLPQERLTQLGKQFDNWTVNDQLYKMQIFAPGGRIGSFELKKYRQQLSPDSPPMELVPAQSSGYLPLAVDLLQHQDWQLSNRLFSSSSPKEIGLSSGDKPQSLSLSTEIPDQVRLSKTFTFTPDSYVVDLDIQLENLSDTVLSDQMGLSFYVQPYTSLKEESSYNASQLSAYQAGSLSNYPLKDLVKKNVILTPPMDWVGYENNYFIQAVVPLEETGYQIVPRVLSEETGLTQVVYLSDPFQINPREKKNFKVRLYMGAKEISRLNQAGHNLSHAVDYGWFTFIAKPLFYVLQWLYKYFHNYGVAIILLTVMIKIVFWPLTQKSYQSMQKMKKVQPKIAQIREKYKDDKEKLNKELMEVYRTHKVNPMGGCLPMILQIPVFFALYRMLYGAVELRHEPFMWWINDLTAPDRLNVGFPIPSLGGFPS